MKRKLIYVDNFLTTHGRTPTTGVTLVKLFRDEEYNVIPTSSKPNKALRLVDMISTIITNRKNAVVLLATYSTSAFYFAYTCSVVCRLYKIPYMPCLHGGNLPTRIKQSPKLSRQFFGKSYINIAVSGYLQQQIINNGWKSKLIPNNIDIAAYPFRLRSKCECKLLWVRSFHSIYNPSLAVRVLHALLQKFPNAHLTMVGPDKDGSLDKCKTLVNDLQLGQHITFTGLLTRDEWVKLSLDHDIFINTTNFDNLPVSVVEAMALGMVVISTNVGGLPYLIEDAGDGLLVPADDETAFVGAVERVVGNVELAAKLSSAARKKAEQYDWNNVRLLWNDLLENI